MPPDPSSQADDAPDAAAQDLLWMARIKQGDTDALRLLIEAHQHRVIGTVAKMLGDDADAEDISQQVFIRVWKSAARYEPTAKFTTWIYTVAHNRLVDHWRKRGLTLVALEGDDVASSSPDPADQAQARESLARFAAALDALPALQREAFLLHEESELSIAEIAQATGANEETAKSRLRYATAKLRAAITDD